MAEPDLLFYYSILFYSSMEDPFRGWSWTMKISFIYTFFNFTLALLYNLVLKRQEHALQKGNRHFHIGGAIYCILPFVPIFNWLGVTQITYWKSVSFQYIYCIYIFRWIDKYTRGSSHTHTAQHEIRTCEKMQMFNYYKRTIHVYFN